MKKLVLASSIAVIAASTHLPVYAKEKSETIKEATIFSSAVAGAVAAGPIGMVLGAVTGAYFSDQKTVHDTRTQLQLSHHINAHLEENINMQNQKIAELEKAVSNKLEFQVLFPTGVDQLSAQDMKRINSLATYLNDNPTLNVRLDGFADPRGTDEYNNVLSQERALSVVKALEEKGIERNRIDFQGHGSSLSIATQGDLEGYAMERRVKIEVYAPETIESQQTVMASNTN